MLDMHEVLETVDMIENEKLDIRTITMGISLVDCADADIDRSCRKIYDKVMKKAEHLVQVGEQLEAKYGIPIVNKRISVTPISILLGVSGGDPVKYAVALDRVANEVGVDFIGGFSALVHRGFSAGDRELIDAVPQALAETELLCSSINIGSTKTGINMDAVRLMGQKIVEAAELTKEKSCIADAKLVVFCNAVEDNPFMAGAFHGIGNADCCVSAGVSGPGVVRSVLKKMPQDAPLDEIAEAIKKTAFKITRVGQLVGSEAARMLDAEFGIIDLSLAPTPAVGDSVARILEEIGLEQCGAAGTTAALAMLNDAVKKGGLMASSSVGGLSGAFIPVSEDEGMMDAARTGSLSIEKLEAMTAVCSVGLDMIVIPGDTTAEVISGIIADEAAIGMVNSKTTAVRVIPAIGVPEGEELDFGGLLGKGPVMPVNRKSPARMIARGGRIPAPMQSLKN